jgi:hypothetical protein
MLRRSDRPPELALWAVRNTRGHGAAGPGTVEALTASMRSRTRLGPPGSAPEAVRRCGKSCRWVSRVSRLGAEQASGTDSGRPARTGAERRESIRAGPLNAGLCESFPAAGHAAPGRVAAEPATRTAQVTSTASSVEGGGHLQPRRDQCVRPTRRAIRQMLRAPCEPVPRLAQAPGVRRRGGDAQGAHFSERARSIPGTTPSTAPGRPESRAGRKKHEAPELASRGLVASLRPAVAYMPESVRISMTRRFN